MSTEREMRRAIVLVCSCGFYWDRAALDEFNAGSPERAAARHRQMWRSHHWAHDLRLTATGAALPAVLRESADQRETE